MDTYTEEDIPAGLPLTAADIALAHYDIPRDLGALPFGPNDVITRSLEDDIARMCDLVASLIQPPGCHDGEEALVVLRRPAPPDPSPSDQRIFRLIREAAVDRETAPWSFFVAGPAGARELHASDAVS